MATLKNKAADRFRTSTILRDHLKNLVPFTEEWIAVMEVTDNTSMESKDMTNWTTEALVAVQESLRYLQLLFGCLRMGNADSKPSSVLLFCCYLEAPTDLLTRFITIRLPFWSMADSL
ncbi:hypothetical protein EJB05_15441, partial [Eragrostis curvula]